VGEARRLRKAVMIGPNRKAWYADEVAEWQNKRKAAA
jgi:predicted DNA-binding transcriptional regulator AlpA